MLTAETEAAIIVVIISIPRSVTANQTAYNVSRVADEIGNGTNESDTDDWYNDISQVVTLNVIKSLEAISAEDIQANVQEQLDEEGSNATIVVIAVQDPVVIIFTTSSTSTSTS
eukprot:2395825-Amphidinium_carterae.1